ICSRDVAVRAALQLTQRHAIKSSMSRTPRPPRRAHWAARAAPHNAGRGRWWWAPSRPVASDNVEVRELERWLALLIIGDFDPTSSTPSPHPPSLPTRPAKSLSRVAALGLPGPILLPGDHFGPHQASGHC